MWIERQGTNSDKQSIWGRIGLIALAVMVAAIAAPAAIRVGHAMSHILEAIAAVASLIAILGIFLQAMPHNKERTGKVASRTRKILEAVALGLSGLGVIVIAREFGLVYGLITAVGLGSLAVTYLLRRTTGN